MRIPVAAATQPELGRAAEINSHAVRANNVYNVAYIVSNNKLPHL